MFRRDPIPPSSEAPKGCPRRELSTWALRLGDAHSADADSFERTSPRRRRCGEMADATNPLGHAPVASSAYSLLVFLSVAVAVRVIVGEPPMPVTVKT